MSLACLTRGRQRTGSGAPSDGRIRPPKTDSGPRHHPESRIPEFGSRSEAATRASSEGVTTPVAAELRPRRGRSWLLPRYGVLRHSGRIKRPRSAPACSTAMSIRVSINCSSTISPETACETFITVPRSSCSTGAPIVMVGQEALCSSWQSDSADQAAAPCPVLPNEDSSSARFEDKAWAIVSKPRSR